MPPAGPAPGPAGGGAGAPAPAAAPAPALDPRVRAAFGYPLAGDEAAARELRALVPRTNTLRELGIELRNRHAIVAGCGPGLEKAQAALFEGRPVVAADGAAQRLRELGVAPAAVVTDLDGDPEALRWAAAQGSILVVHAHGDNRAAVARLAPQLGPRIRGTHQAESLVADAALAPLANVGGFTDGDRAVCLLERLGAASALLVGFETDRPPSRYSHQWDPATKPQKLAWAQRLLGEVQARGRLPLRLWVP